MAVNRINKLVLIASSTGGPKALHTLIPHLDKRLDAPVVIVQHMPRGFTGSLAERLNEISAISVSEASDGEKLDKGHVYIARGGMHLLLKMDGQGRLIFEESDAEAVNGLRPCADVTFESAAPLSIDSIICVVLTGMGADGYKGIRHIKDWHSVYTIAQNKATCVVYGMPKVVVEHGIADIVLPLEDISKEIINKVGVY